MFIYSRSVHVYETDLMGIVHHSNYLRICEEARVAYFTKNKPEGLDTQDVFGLAVYETKVLHKFPLRYGNRFDVEMQLKANKAKLTIQYKIKYQQQLCALVETIHCCVDQQMKVQRLNSGLLQKLENEKWIETWL